jgi:sporulation protein YlmC with PRC-barrel domain
MDLVRDLLDKAVVDRNGREMGRIDGLELDLVDGQPPRLAAILMGPAVLGDRLHPTIGRCVTAVEAWLRLGEGRPVRVETDDIAEIDRKVKLRLAIGETAAEAVEQRLRAWVLKIPGSR